MIHIVIKRILENDMLNSCTNQIDMHDSVGTMIALCHVLCSADILADVSASRQVAIGTIISQSLSCSKMPFDGPSTIKLILATILKMITTAPSCFRSAYPVVTGTLRAYATVDESQDGIVCKILALQVLSAVAQTSESEFVFMETFNAIRPAVLSLLGVATDHPLSVLRSAAAEVRNQWYVVA